MKCKLSVTDKGKTYVLKYPHEHFMDGQVYFQGFYRTFTQKDDMFCIDVTPNVALIKEHKEYIESLLRYMSDTYIPGREIQSIVWDEEHDAGVVRYDDTFHRFQIFTLQEDTTRISVNFLSKTQVLFIK